MTIDIWETFLLLSLLVKVMKDPDSLFYLFSASSSASTLMIAVLGMSAANNNTGNGRHEACPCVGNRHKRRFILVEVKVPKGC